MNSESSTRIMINHEVRINVNNIYLEWCSSLGEPNFFILVQYKKFTGLF